MALSRGEKRTVIAACIVACVLGAFGAFIAYSLVEEGQFHGGVLEEDRAQATLSLVQAAFLAFVEYGLGAFIALGALPIIVWRLVSRRPHGS